MDHIDRLIVEDPPNLQARAGVHRQLEGHSRRHSMHAQAVDLIDTGEDALMAGRRCDDPQVMSPRLLLQSK